jgi:8-oxo-dGTP diphosphatase
LPGDSDHEVLAAGGVVARRDDDGPVRVAVIHRPKYDDWTLPKGKLEPGEGWEEAALREVEEETGIRARIGEELDSVRYTDRHGRSKLARYWRMTPEEEGEFIPNREVDRVEWLTPDEARERLTHEFDRGLVGKLDVR